MIINYFAQYGTDFDEKDASEMLAQVDAEETED